MSLLDAFNKRKAEQAVYNTYASNILDALCVVWDTEDLLARYERLQGFGLALSCINVAEPSDDAFWLARLTLTMYLDEVEAAMDTQGDNDG